jgi:hypothetical protein
VLHLFRSPAPRYLPTAETDVPNVQEEVSFGLSGKSVPAFFAVFQSIRFVSVQMVQHEQQEFLSHLPQPVLNQIIIFMLLYFNNKSFVDGTFLIKVEVVTNRI